MLRPLSRLGVGLALLGSLMIPVFAHSGPDVPGPMVTPAPPSTQQHVTKGQAIYVARCMTCHDNAASADNYVRFGVNPATLQYFKTQPAPGDNGSFPQEMWDKLQTLSPQDMDDLSLYLTMMDATSYTIKGRVVTQPPVLPIANATVVLHTRSLAGQDAYFPAQVTHTDAQGYYTFHCLAGAKTIAVQAPGYTFSKTELKAEVNFYTKNQGTVVIDGNTISVSTGPNGSHPVVTGYDFHASPKIVINNPHVRPTR